MNRDTHRTFLAASHSSTEANVTRAWASLLVGPHSKVTLETSPNCTNHLRT